MDERSKDNARLRISFESVEIEGAEEFVERLAEKLGLTKLIDRIEAVSGNAEESNEKQKEEPNCMAVLPSPPSRESPLETFDEVYAETDSGFTIIADVEENTIAKTARNYILLHLYGAYLTGRLEVSDDEIRDICQTHACYDPGNFASHVKGLGSKVIRSGGARSYTLKLTAPGIRAGKQYASDVQKRAMDQ